VQVLRSIEYGRRDFHDLISRQECVGQHVFDRFSDPMSVDSLEQTESRVIELIEIVDFLVVPTDLVINNPRHFHESRAIDGRLDPHVVAIPLQIVVFVHIQRVALV